MKAWTALCQPTEQPADPDFLAVYPHVTTVQRERRSAAAAATRRRSPSRLASLFKKHLARP